MLARLVRAVRVLNCITIKDQRLGAVVPIALPGVNATDSLSIGTAYLLNMTHKKTAH